MGSISIIDMLKELGVAGVTIICVIIGVFIFALFINFITIYKYKSIASCFKNKKQTKTGIFKNDLLNTIVQDYKVAAKNSLSEVNTQAIIENCFNSKLSKTKIAESFVNKSPSILIILGLLGTFWGLTNSVTKLIEVISSNIVSNVDINIDIILEKLSGTATGMGFAFATSLFGIAFSILLTIIYIFSNCQKERENLMVTIEEYLDNTVAVAISKDKETEYTMLNNILRETFVEFGTKIQNSLKLTVDEFGDKLTNVVMDVSVSSQTLDNTVERFDRSLDNFSENMKSLSEFNSNMKNNIQLMDVNFIKVTDSLNKTASVINDNYSAMSDFSTQVKEVSDQITTFNTDVLTQIEGVMEKMDRTVTAMHKFGESLTEHADNSSAEMAKLQRGFLDSLHAFSNDLETLGGQISDSVLKALENGNQQISTEIVTNIKDALSEILLMLDNFKENEKLLAKTITMLPQQVMTYNRVATSNIQGKLDDIQSAIEKNEFPDDNKKSDKSE